MLTSAKEGVLQAWSISGRSVEPVKLRREGKLELGNPVC